MLESIDHFESGLMALHGDDGILVTQDIEAVLEETLRIRNNPIADSKEAKLRHVATIPASVAVELEQVTGLSFHQIPTEEVILLAKMRYPNLLTGKL
jgi:hypothetical protein